MDSLPLHYLLRNAADAAESNELFSASYLIHRLKAYAGGSVLSVLPDDVMLHIIRFLIPSPILPSSVMSVKPVVLAMCGKRGQSLLDIIFPGALDAMKMLHHYRTSVASAASKLGCKAEDAVAHQTNPLHNRSHDVGYCITFSDGTSDFAWFRERGGEVPTYATYMRNVALNISERDIFISHRKPILVSMHASVVRSKWATSPFEFTKEFCVFIRDEWRLIRWINATPEAVAQIDFGDGPCLGV